jgi:hypothetical protein
MTRPHIGIVGALVALGGFLALRYVQRGRTAQVPVTRDLNRWEGEGGAVAAPSTVPSTSQAAAAGASPGTAGTNGAAYPGGNGGAWPFPHS